MLYCLYKLYKLYKGGKNIDDLNPGNEAGTLFRLEDYRDRLKRKTGNDLTRSEAAVVLLKLMLQERGCCKQAINGHKKGGSTMELKLRYVDGPEDFYFLLVGSLLIINNVHKDSREIQEAIDRIQNLENRD